MVSVAATALLFLLLTYTGILPAVVNWLLKLFGYGSWEGEDRANPTVWMMIGCAVVLFLLVVWLSGRFVFRKRK